MGPAVGLGCSAIGVGFPSLNDEERLLFEVIFIGLGFTGLDMMLVCVSFSAVLGLLSSFCGLLLSSASLSLAVFQGSSSCFLVYSISSEA